MVEDVLAKVLHQPTVALKEAAGTPRGERLVEALRSLFDLEPRRAHGGGPGRPDRPCDWPPGDRRWPGGRPTGWPPSWPRSVIPAGPVGRRGRPGRCEIVVVQTRATSWPKCP